jgi:hypothetical protein
VYVLNKLNSQIKEYFTELILCGFCLAIKGRSRKFKNQYQLTYHTTHIHKNDLGIITPVIINPHKTVKREILD